MQLIDTHCHLDLDVFNEDREEILLHCKQLGIDKIIVPAITAAGWNQLTAITQQSDQLFPAFGLHPVFIEQHNQIHIEQLNQVCKVTQPVAIGEIGLDFYIKDTDKNKQIEYFDRQLDIAEEMQLPVILHIRKAHDQVLQILKKKNLPGGSCHAFSGSLQQANQYIDMGFKLGFGGTLTYPNARKIHSLAKELSLKDIILETDAPDMSGYKHKGKRNSPEYLPDALQALAEIKSKSIEEVAQQTTRNACQLFHL